MRVGVDEARKHGLATEINLSNARRREIDHLRILSHGKKSAPRYGDSLGDRIRRTHRHNVAVMKNQLWFFLLKGKESEGSERA